MVLNTNGNLVLTQNTISGGNPVALTVVGGAHTTSGNSNNWNQIFFNIQQTKQFAGAAGPTTLASTRGVNISGQTTYSTAGAGAFTITTASSFRIGGAPIAGTGVTITNAYSLEVAGGLSGFGGTIQPITSDGSALGTTAKMWSDLFLCYLLNSFLNSQG